MSFQNWYLKNGALAKKKWCHHFVSKVINPQCPSTRTFSERFHQQKNIQKILFFQPSSHLRHQIQQMVNWWFGAPVVWIPGIPLWKGIGILGGTLESQTTNRNHQFIIGWQNGCYRWWVDVGWLFTPKLPGEFFPGGFLGGSNAGFLGQFVGWQKLLLTNASWISFEATFAVCKSTSSASQSTSCWLKMGDYNLEWNLKDQFPASPKTRFKIIGFSPKTIFLVGNFNHPKFGTIIFVVFGLGLPGN